ncbi:MAG: DUF5690 family protein [Bacteroidales bacterium]|nr:DUF5690 family protein [Bacteroidales bacterium]
MSARITSGEKSERTPLYKAQRKALLKKYSAFLIPLLLVNVLYTVLRDIIHVIRQITGY